MSCSLLPALRRSRLFSSFFAATAALALAAGVGAADPTAFIQAGQAQAGAGNLSDLLSTGDLVHIEVYDNPDLTIDLRVPQQGAVQFPLVGPIAGIDGMTCDELSTRFRNLLEARFLNHALVTATVKELAPRNAFVMGAVAKPGAFELANDHSCTAIRALSEAGGLVDDADRHHIVVLRNECGGDQAIPVALDGDPGHAGDVVLRPNDLVMVARLDRIYVTGQVKQPGSVPSDEAGLTLAKAISLVGGFDRYARPTRVQLLRAGAPMREVDVTEILAGKAADPALIPGDMINVPERRF